MTVGNVLVSNNNLPTQCSVNRRPMLSWSSPLIGEAGLVQAAFAQTSPHQHLDSFLV